MARDSGVYRLEHEVTHPVTDKDNLWGAEFDLPAYYYRVKETHPNRLPSDF